MSKRTKQTLVLIIGSIEFVLCLTCAVIGVHRQQPAAVFLWMIFAFVFPAVWTLGVLDLLDE